MAKQTAEQPLSGVRVLELTRLLPGPLAGRHLADLGAEVIKVEDTEHGDYVRGIGAMKGENSGAFHALNRNKKSLRLDYRTDRGRGVFLALAARSEVVLEGFRPGTMARLGLDYPTLRRGNPALVYCALTGFGQDGPYRDRAGHDMNYASYAGMTDQVGNRGGPPANANFQYADIAGGTMGAMMGILAALYDAQRSGQGRYIDVPITDCALAQMAVAWSQYEATGRMPERGGDLISGKYPWYDFYQAADGGYVHLGALEWRFWRNFCDAVGRPEWADRQMAEGAEAEAMRAEIAAYFRREDRDALVARLAPLDTCVAPVLRLEECARAEAFRDRGLFVEVEDPRDGVVAHIAFPVRFDGAAPTAPQPAPGWGEHSEAVLRAIDLPTAEIAALRDDGII
jgi:crotonobetainyl-CoA:carnitine CoA-transferase CaiB-like acyl-CoA transferase